MFAKFPRGGVDQYLFQLEVNIPCDDYTGCDEVDSYFATEAGIMISLRIYCDICYTI